MRGQINWQDGYAAVKKDADVTRPNKHDPRAPDSSTKQGRGALPDWKKFGWIAPNFSRAVSRAVEYAVNDFSVSQIAKGLGLTEHARKYVKRSQYWRNYWDPKQKSLNSSGFMIPRYAKAAGFNNNSFEHPYNPLQCGDCYWEGPYYEDVPWSYSFNAHHDIYHLIKLSGGADAFVDRLETFFKPGLFPKNSLFGSTIFNPSNEPAFTTPYLFNFFGR